MRALPLGVSAIVVDAAPAALPRPCLGMHATPKGRSLTYRRCALQSSGRIQMVRRGRAHLRCAMASGMAINVAIGRQMTLKEL